MPDTDMKNGTFFQTRVAYPDVRVDAEIRPTALEVYSQFVCLLCRGITISRALILFWGEDHVYACVQRVTVRAGI